MSYHFLESAESAGGDRELAQSGAALLSGLAPTTTTTATAEAAGPTRTCDRVTAGAEGLPPPLPAPEPAQCAIPVAGLNATLPAPTPPLPRQGSPERPPTPTTALIAQLQGLDVGEVEAVLVGVREAWQRGDQSVIADALFSQAVLAETVAAKVLRLAGSTDNPRAMDTYAGLALRALEQARKALGTLAGLKEKPRVTNAVQVNVGAPVTAVTASGLISSSNEILPNSDVNGDDDGE